MALGDKQPEVHEYKVVLRTMADHTVRVEAESREQAEILAREKLADHGAEVVRHYGYSVYSAERTDA